MDEYDVQRGGIHIRTADGESVDSRGPNEASETTGAYFQADGGDQIIIRPTIYTQPGPRMVRCPVCLGRRAEDTMFTCIHCGKEVCEECRDETRDHWCVRCAQGRYEIVLQFSQTESDTDLRWLHVSSDLFTAPYGDDFPWSFSSAEGAEIPETAEPALGDRLFGAVFPEGKWTEFQGTAERELQHGTGLRFRLADLPPDLARLPWEQLVIPEHPSPHEPRLSVVRWQEAGVRTAVLEPAPGPLRVLVFEVPATASAAGEEAVSEHDALSADLTEAIESGKLVLERVKLPGSSDGADPATIARRALEALRAALQTRGGHILHLAGSPTWVDGPAPGLGWTMDGSEVVLPLAELDLWLQDSPLQVIFLAGGIMREDAWQPVIAMSNDETAHLLQGNVVGLVSPREALSRPPLRRFASALYETLAAGQDLEAAVGVARRALATALGRDAERLAWSVPALLLRAWDGHFLNLQAPEGPVAAAPPVDERLIDERLDDVRKEEAPAKLASIVKCVREHRLHLIYGAPDAVPFETGRQAARELADEDRDRRILRYPRYEPIQGFLSCVRNVPADSVLLLDTNDLGPLGDEMDALLDLAQQRKVYVLITLADEAATSDDTGLARWLGRQRKLCTHITDESYKPEAIRHLLSRQAEALLAAGLLHPATVSFLKTRAANAEGFARFTDRLRLPGQVIRLLYGPAASPTIVRDDEALSAALDEIASAPETIRRWWTSELAASQQVLVMVLTLLPGLPLHLLTPFYRATVERLRRAFHLELAALPVRAQLRSWQNYLFEARRRIEDGEEIALVEFRSAQYAAEVLEILSREYGEWLAEIIPLCGQALLGRGPLEAVEGSRSPDLDHRLARAAATRGLGAIGASSARSLRLVVKQLEGVLKDAPTDDRGRPDWELLPMPGRIFVQVAEVQSAELAGQVRSALNEWRQRPELNHRLAATSAYGQLARIMPPERLIAPLSLMAAEAQTSAEQAIAAHRRKVDDENGADAVQKDSEEVRRAVAHSLRWFPASALPALGDLYGRLAADHDMKTRANIAVALARSVADPAEVHGWLEHWLSDGNWWAWWTATASVALLYETSRLPMEDASRLLWLGVQGAVELASRRNKSPEDLGQDLAWAASTCLARASDFTEACPTLKRTLMLLGELLGQEPRADSVLRGAFTRLAEGGEKVRPEARRTAVEVLLASLKPGAYRLEPATRNLAVEVLLGTNELRQPAYLKQVRALAEFEAFDYRWLHGRALADLPLRHLGLGGALLSALLAGDQAMLETALPFINQVASIGKDENLRALGPFTLVNLAMGQPALLGTVLKVLERWSNAPQTPTQLSLVDSTVEMFCRLPAEHAGDALAVLSAAVPKLTHQAGDHLRLRLPEIARNSPDAAASLWQILEEHRAAAAQEVQ